MSTSPNQSNPVLIEYFNIFEGLCIRYDTMSAGVPSMFIKQIQIMFIERNAPHIARLGELYRELIKLNLNHLVE